jgi:hypothetical protein
MAGHQRTAATPAGGGRADTPAGGGRRAADRKALYYGWAYVEAEKMYQQISDILVRRASLGITV